MTASMNRVLAAVDPPDRTGALVLLAKAIVSLATVNAAIDALQRAEVVSQSGTRGTKKVRGVDDVAPANGGRELAGPRAERIVEGANVDARESAGEQSLARTGSTPDLSHDTAAVQNERHLETRLRFPRVG